MALRDYIMRLGEPAIADYVHKLPCRLTNAYWFTNQN
jgi:hypothetical protein